MSRLYFPGSSSLGTQRAMDWGFCAMQTSSKGCYGKSFWHLGLVVVGCAGRIENRA